MSLSNITKDINAAVDTLSNEGDINNEERMEFFAACEKLKATLETPLDFMKRESFGGHRSVALRLGVEMGLFNVMVKADGGNVEIAELAASTGADALFTLRLMRVLTAMNLFKEAEEGTYTATPLAGAFIDDSPLAAAAIHIGLMGEVLSKFPDYFRQNGYKSPGDAYSGPFQSAMGTKLHCFEWLMENPEHQKAFSNLMKATRLDRGDNWFEFFPTEERFSHHSVLDASKPLLIDIGGGLGHDLMAFKANYPNIVGRLILQDLPMVIDNIKEIGPGLETMKYDFFTPQPIKGARAYFLRNVLHDWPDKNSRQILRNILPAMTGESILLINEGVLPEVNVALFPAQIDLSMMALYAGLERTQKQWIELLDSAGFELVKTWTPRAPVAGFGVLFEAVPKR
ncbi:hypothetical protein MMC22_006579 [Lobaria immixta]|nr:hypothetical protein [Lobaria immixta]